MDIKAILKRLQTENKGQTAITTFIGVLVLIIVVAISQVVVTNVLNVANINTGLWTLLPVLWPVIPILLLVAAMGGAVLFFRQ